MLETFISMISQADMLHGCSSHEDKVIFDGEEIDVVVVTVPTNENGDSIEAVFHKGTDTLIDMNVRHICTCGHHHH